MIETGKSDTCTNKSKVDLKIMSVLNGDGIHGVCIVFVGKQSGDPAEWGRKFEAMRKRMGQDKVEPGSQRTVKARLKSFWFK